MLSKGSYEIAPRRPELLEGVWNCSLCDRSRSKNVVRILIPTLGALAGTGRVSCRFGKHRDVAHLLDPPVVEDDDVRRVTGRIHGDRQAIVKPGGSVRGEQENLTGLVLGWLPTATNLPTHLPPMPGHGRALKTDPLSRCRSGRQDLFRQIRDGGLAGRKLEHSIRSAARDAL